MKHSSKLKKQSGQPNLPHSAVARSSRLRWVLILLGTLLTASATWAFFEYVVWATTPPELVGKWVVTEGPDEGGTVDFFRNGTMAAKVNVRGYEGIIDARIRVEDKKIYVTTTNRQTGQTGTRVQTIKLLDETNLVLEDERGMSVKMERAR